jgi:hypothetical protein
MMDGRKMEAFLLDCSFIGWHLLGYLTFGLAEALWVVPYQTAVFAEFYADARNEAKERAVEGCEYMNDGYLFTEAPENELKNAYADIEEQIKFVEDNSIELAPVNAFFAENFSLWLGSSAEKQRYDEVDSVRKQIEEDTNVINGENRWSEWVDRYYKAEVVTAEMVTAMIKEIRLHSDSTITIKFLHEDDFEALLAKCEAVREEVA